MENIRKPINRILLNSLGTDKVGLYGDARQGSKIMRFFGKGGPAVDIIGDDYTSGTPSASGTKNANMEVSKTESDSGVKDMMLFYLNPASSPCSDCDWDYGITVREKVKKPGVRTRRTNLNEKSYTNTMSRINVTTGEIDDTYIKTAEEDIIDQIAADLGQHNVEVSDEANMARGVVEAMTAYKFDIDTDSAADVTITIDGTATTISLNTASIDSAHAINNNATVKAYVQAFAVDTNTVMVIGRTNGQKFTLADGLAADHPITNIQRYVLLKAKSVDVQFDVSPGVNLSTDHIVTEKIGLYYTSGTTTAGTTTISVDGTATAGLNDNVDQDTYADNLNTGFTDASLTGIYASYDAYTSEGIIYHDYTVKSVRFAFSSTSTTSIASKWSSYAVYPSFVADDVFRIFANHKDAGILSNYIRLDQPIEGEDYVLYRIKTKNQNISALHGPSYGALASTEYEIYVKADIVTTDYWDATNPSGAGTKNTFMQKSTVTGFSADTNFEELLQILVGTAPSTW